MAPRLQPNDDSKVVHLKPRKAKGAGGQKRKGPSTTRLKPTASAPAAPRKPKGHPSDAEVRANMQDRVVALHHKLRAVENREAVANDALGDIRTEKKQARAAIGNIVPLELYDEAAKKLKLKTNKVDLQERERLRALIHEAFGLPAGPVAELDFAKVPEAAKPALYWEDVGYRVMIDGTQFADPQRDGVPPENVQDYMRGCEKATRKIGEGMKRIAADPPIEVAPPLMVGEKPDKAAAKKAAKDAAADVGIVGNDASPADPWAVFDNDPDQWSESQWATFKAWYEGLDPEEDVDITHPGVEIAFDRELEAAGVAPPAADGFETSPEELAGQTTRRVVQEQREASEFSDD